MKQSKLFSRKNTSGSSTLPNYSFLRSMLLWIAFLAATASYAQQPFITTWKTDNSGISNSTSITIPTTGGGYNYEVDWNNDGIYDQSGITGDVTHNFGVAGTYTIRIRGTFPRIYCTFNGDHDKLINVGQWGDIAWTSMASAFLSCSNLNISASDLPNLSGVADMSFMFADCSSLNGPANIGDWNTANVTTMEGMFYSVDVFNQPIGNWNTTNVTNMSDMFNHADAFNQPIGNWNTANVVTMNNMFDFAIAFNQPISNWNTANVTTMNNMFYAADAFNQPIGNWNTANVTNMSGMFSSADAFNQPIGNWNTANVTTMEGMFYYAVAFNQPIDNWNTANVTSMVAMFEGALTFNQPIGDWTLNSTVSLFNMLNMSGMDCTNYSTILINWNNNPATPNGRVLGAAGLHYNNNTAAAAHNNLIAIKGWSIVGDIPYENCLIPLPVELITFTGKQQKDDVLLTWQTASEQNNAGFYVERSADGLRWETLGFVAGKGTTTEAQNYSFLDNSPLQGGRGVIYYRLRQIDFNGKEEMSEVVSIELKNVGTVRIFPNPVSNGELTLLLPENVEQEVTMQLFSPTGQLLRSMSAHGGTNPLAVNGLPTGVYTLQVVSSTEISLEKIVIEN